MAVIEAPSVEACRRFDPTSFRLHHESSEEDLLDIDSM